MGLDVADDLSLDFQTSVGPLLMGAGATEGACPSSELGCVVMAWTDESSSLSKTVCRR